MNRIRQMTELMHATRKEVSMRRKLVAYWASMIFVLLAAMLVLASLFGVFSIRESNLRHALDAHHTSTVASVKKQTSVLAAHAIALSQESSNALDHQLLTHPTSKLNDDPEGIACAERRCSPCCAPRLRRVRAAALSSSSTPLSTHRSTTPKTLAPVCTSGLRISV